MKIEQEGKFRKLVKEVQQVSYNGAEALKRGQNMLYVTERAVFRLTKAGPELIEIAKGVDLQKDILDQMEFTPLIAKKLKVTSTDFYKDGICGLRKLIERS